jgi:hypothetical protein
VAFCLAPAIARRSSCEHHCCTGCPPLLLLHRFRVVRMLRESPFPVAHVMMWADEEEAQVYAGR